MGLPEEDLGPTWLRDYGDIEVDIDQLADFAAALQAEVTDNYIPHLARLYDDMSARAPDPCDAFPELVTFLQTHQASQQATTDLVHFYRDASGGLAVAAGEISKRYGDSDAFSAALVRVVEQELNRTAAAPPRSPTGTEAVA